MGDEMLMTYRAYASANQFFEKVISRFNSVPPLNVLQKPETIDVWVINTLPAIRTKVIDFITKWMSIYAFDWDVIPLDTWQKFKTMVDMSPFKMLMENAVLEDRERVLPDLLSAPKSIPALSTSTTTFPILQWDPVEIARQLSLIEYQMLCNIEIQECFNQNWIRSNREIDSPNIVQMVNWFNKLSLYFASLILNDEAPKDRAEKYAFVVRIAQECQKINNLNGLFEIVSCLSSTPVYRLKKTMEKVPTSEIQKYNELQHYILPDQNYRVLRSAVTFNAPCIPYPGLILSDLIFVDEGNKSIVEEKTNFLKCRKIAKSLSELLKYQVLPFNFHPIKELQEIIFNCTNHSFTDPQLYQKSLELEPRESNVTEVDNESSWRKAITNTFGNNVNRTVGLISFMNFFKQEDSQLTRKTSGEMPKTPRKLEGRGRTQSFSEDPNAPKVLNPRTVSEEKNKSGWVHMLDEKKSWKKRYVIVQGAYLLYFESDKTQKELGNVVLQAALIENVPLEVSSKEFGKPDCIRIVHGKKQVVLQAGSVEEALEFGYNLRKACQRYTGATIQVDKDGPIKTIQDAILKAQPLDKISVKAGTYEESLIVDKNIAFEGKGVIVKNKKTPSLTVSSPGAVKFTGFTFENDSELSCVVLKTGSLFMSSCEIKGSRECGLKTLLGSQLTMTKCMITGSGAHGMILKTSCYLEGCNIVANKQDGINNLSSAPMTLKKCLIGNNYNGVVIIADIYSRIEGCKVIKNRCDGIFSKGTSYIQDCEFVDNKGWGCVFNRKLDPANMVNNKIENNTAGSIKNL
jgi:hypothetical protein